MEIVKEGNINRQDYEAACSYCGCVFRFKERDTYFKTHLFSCMGEYYAVHCPQCKNGLRMCSNVKKLHESAKTLW